MRADLLDELFDKNTGFANMSQHHDNSNRLTDTFNISQEVANHSKDSAHGRRSERKTYVNSQMASQSLNHHQLFQQIGLMDDRGDASGSAALQQLGAGARPAGDGMHVQEVSESNNSPPEGPRE